MTTYTITGDADLPSAARLDLDSGDPITCRFVRNDAQSAYMALKYLCAPEPGTDTRNTLADVTGGGVLKSETAQAAAHACNRRPALGPPFPTVSYTVTKCVNIRDDQLAELEITVTPA